MEGTNAIITCLVQTKSLERVLSPISAKVLYFYPEEPKIGDPPSPVVYLMNQPHNYCHIASIVNVITNLQLKLENILQVSLKIGVHVGVQI